jgi:hypothetical protein
MNTPQAHKSTDAGAPFAWKRGRYEDARDSIIVLSGSVWGVHQALKNCGQDDSPFMTTLSIFLYGIFYGGTAMLLTKLPIEDFGWALPVLVTIRVCATIRGVTPA